jgi:uncharacterized protein YcfJ
MKRTTGLIVAAVAAIGTAQASHERGAPNGAYYTDAEVIDVKPILRIVQVSEPRESCWNETVRHESYGHGYRSRTPMVLGGILGGVVGHQFGSGRGNDVMTVAGALLGASIGRDAAYRRQAMAQPAYTTERRCEVSEAVREEERLEGYQVRYRLDGREFVTRTATDPGPRLRVRVQVDPASYD